MPQFAHVFGHAHWPSPQFAGTVDVVVPVLLVVVLDVRATESMWPALLRHSGMFPQRVFSR
jgi:hypothetical protein